MHWFVGIDGGGSKTDFAVATADGTLRSMLRLAGCSHQSIGVNLAVQRITEGLRQCLSQAKVRLADCAGCCIGLPCYGEDAAADAQMAAQLKAALAPLPLHLVNDVEVGWAGSLECSEGIHLVAGTGSIAFARTAQNETARCGGWVEFFGDEGSGYWVGRQAMSVFSKQADGRLPRGALYELVRQEFHLSNDCEFIQLVLTKIAPHREKVAQFQTLAERAALAGDATAATLYEAAAAELAQLVAALRGQLSFSRPEVPVSYSGGVFKAGDLVLTPLQKHIEQLGCKLIQPKRSAVEGAVLLAVEQYNRRT